ncbi:MAG: T9SS type A sorting domain-containing protein [Bacteroidia bacterium]|nr:T9SS type A sorting domain-containing protein [Bacteroidia bacterium]
MRRNLLLAFCLSVVLLNLFSQNLSMAAPVTVFAGSNATVTPVSIPSNTVKISVSSSGNFSGILTASSTTRKITITDAKPVGTYLITVKSFNSSGGSTSTTFTLIVKQPACANGLFNGTNDVSILRPNLTSVAVADFNGDGAQDLAAAHEGYNTVSIKLGNGSGGFTGSSEIPVTSHPYGLAIGDLDLDGKQDFVVTNEGSDIVAVRLGDGTGGFITRANANVGASPMNIALADFNKDGKPDFVNTNYHGQGVSVRLGDGTGHFTTMPDVSTGDFPIGVAIGDFNQDGKHDFVTANSGPGTLSIRLGDGLGGFTAANDVFVGFNPYNVCVGDFNRDGKQDLASANFASNTVSIRYGTGTGGFNGNTEVPVGMGPYSITLGNFNGDEISDIAVTSYFTNSVSILLGNGVGGFTSNPSVPVGAYPVCVAVGDFNGDRKQDLAVANYTDHSVSIRSGLTGTSPVIPVSNNSPVCEGTSLELTPSGGRTFLWIGPNGFSSTLMNPVIPAVSMNGAGAYSVIITDSSGCTTISNTAATIYPMPAVTLNLVSDSVCTSDPVLLLSGGSPLGCTYSGNGVFGGNQFDGGLVGVGNYYIYYTCTDSNSCSGTDSSKMHVVLCTDIADNNSESRMQIYPNPVTEEFVLYSSNHDEDGVFALYSTEGKLIKDGIVPRNTHSKISMQGMVGGLYFLKYSTKTTVEFLRIIKSRD